LGSSGAGFFSSAGAAADPGAAFNATHSHTPYIGHVARLPLVVLAVAVAVVVMS